jgi:hypothetical protein
MYPVGHLVKWFNHLPPDRTMSELKCLFLRCFKCFTLSGVPTNVKPPNVDNLFVNKLFRYINSMFWNHLRLLQAMINVNK